MKPVRLFACIIALLLIFSFSQVVCAREKCIREIWSVAEQNRKPTGYGVDKLWQSKSGYLYTSDATIRLTFLGSEPTTVTQHVEMAVDRKFRAKTFRSVVMVNASRTVVTADFGPTQVKVVTVTPDGNEQTDYQKIDKPLYFAASFLDAILRKGSLKVGRSVKGAIWDIESLAPLKYVLRVARKATYVYRHKKINVLRISETTNHETSSLIDAKGRFYWGYDSRLKLNFYRVSKNEIPELAALAVDVLFVPADRHITFPYRSDASKLRITWKSVNFQDLELFDNRQVLRQHRETPDGHAAVIEIHREQRDFTGRTVLPVQDPKLGSYLADAPYITPSSPAIHQLCGEILGDTTDGWLATQKLVHWVYNYIKPAQVAETLTTEQILTQKAGKCVEYAVLFAALARAAGLPTRLALGERYQDNGWIGHMWNEVWLGEWVAVDASHNQIAPDALLLKLVASATVSGTQKVRIGLTNELGISIEDVREADEDARPSATNRPPLQTGITDQTYTNADFRCRISIPEGWKLLESQEQGLPEMVAQSEQEPLADIVLVMFSIPPGTTPELILNARIPAIKKAVREFSLQQTGNVRLGPAPAAVGMWDFGPPEQRIRQQNWIMIRDDQGYLLVFQAPLSQWNDMESLFEKVREQFQILN